MKKSIKNFKENKEEVTRVNHIQMSHIKGGKSRPPKAAMGIPDWLRKLLDSMNI